MFGVDYFNGQGGTNGVDGLDAVIDSVYIDSLVQSYVSNNNNSPRGGCDFSFPEGYGNHISISPDDYSGNYYVVPNGKRLYVFGGALVYVNDRLTTPYSSLGWKHNNPIILNSGDSLSHGGASGPGPQYFDCILLNENTSISAVNREISASNPYIVPLGKEMYVMTIQNSNNSIRVNNKSYFYGTVVHLFPGDTLATFSGINTINGYLVDENYFTGCGGGGSSINPVLNNETVILDLSNFAGLDCDSINNLNFGDIVINAQGQTSIVVPGESCGGVAQNSGYPPYVNPQSIFPVSSRNYYCFFTVNDTIVLTGTPQFYTSGVQTISSITSYGEFISDFDPNSTSSVSSISNNGGFLLPGYIYSLQGGTADLPYQNTATNIFQTSTSSFNLNPEMFNELGIYNRYFGDPVIYPSNNFGLTNAGFTYSSFGKKLKNF